MKNWVKCVDVVEVFLFVVAVVVVTVVVLVFQVICVVLVFLFFGRMKNWVKRVGCQRPFHLSFLFIVPK